MSVHVFCSGIKYKKISLLVNHLSLNLGRAIWEHKEAINWDGQVKLHPEIFFTSIDQRSECAVGESACAVLVAFIVDWMKVDQVQMPIMWVWYPDQRYIIRMEKEKIILTPKIHPHLERDWIRTIKRVQDKHFNLRYCFASQIPSCICSYRTTSWQGGLGMEACIGGREKYNLGGDTEHGGSWRSCQTDPVEDENWKGSTNQSSSAVHSLLAVSLAFADMDVILLPRHAKYLLLSNNIYIVEVVWLEDILPAFIKKKKDILPAKGFYIHKSKAMT